jgi:serine acetyltransferase
VSTARWLDRSRRDGVYATKVAHKHPDYAAASPFWHVSRINKLSRPVLAVSAAAPPLGAALARVGMAVAETADRLGLARAAVAGTTLVYGIQFYRGVREETGGLGVLLRDYRTFKNAVATVTDGKSAASRGLYAAIRADHAMLQRSQDKYGGEPAARPLAAEIVQNIGLQILVAYRVMRALHTNGHHVAAKIMSRVIRHLYGSDIHWEADFAPGIVLVHGFGLAISKAARVSEGCILFHGVTLGMGRDGKTGATGAPLLERDVHVGVGATLVGPITVGKESKIMAGCTVTQSVPARSLVESPAAAVRAR